MFGRLDRQGEAKSKTPTPLGPSPTSRINEIADELIRDSWVKRTYRTPSPPLSCDVGKVTGSGRDFSVLAHIGDDCSKNAALSRGLAHGGVFSAHEEKRTRSNLHRIYMPLNLLK
jgi:hypothetical protein